MNCIWLNVWTYLTSFYFQRLLVTSAFVTGGCLALATAAAWLGRGQWAGLALAGAVAADNVGLQPAPYALLADMFHYQVKLKIYINKI